MRTALDNETGEDIQLNVTFRSAEKPAHGRLPAGRRLHLPSEVGQIDRIEYAYGAHACVMTHDQVIAAVHPGKSAKAVVKLGTVRLISIPFFPLIPANAGTQIVWLRNRVIGGAPE